MIKFEEHDGMLFKMLDKPVPLTPDAEMPCLVRLIQDDSPMGRYNQSYSEYRYGVRLGCCMLPIIATHIAKNGVVNDIEWDVSRYEIIGTFVEEGSDKWALYQMMRGNKVRHKFHIMPNTHYAMNEKRQIAIFTMPSSMVYGGYVVCHANDWLTSRRVDTMTDERTGWQIYKEPKEEPQHAKEPIANCENCKHVCTNSNIDHCHMYEPKPKSENIIHGHIPADMHLKYIHLFKVGDWVEHKESKEQATIRRIMSYGAIEIEFAYSTESDIYQANDFYNDFRKLSPSEVIVKIGCLSGTIAKSSDPNYFLMLHSRPVTDCNHSIIRFSAIDTETRELVESLLEAQEEESND